MMQLDLEELEQMVLRTTPGPWYVSKLSDAVSMSLICITTVPIKGSGLPWTTLGSDNIVAATLVQEPRYVDHQTHLWEENAEFIAKARDAIPALIAEVRMLRNQLHR